MKKSCCLFVDFFIISSDLYRRLCFLFYLTHGVTFILDLQSPLSSGPSSCLRILSSSERADFSPVRATWRKWSMEMEKKKIVEQLRPVAVHVSERDTATRTYKLFVWAIKIYKTSKESICTIEGRFQRELRFSLMQDWFFKVTNSICSKDFQECFSLTLCRCKNIE